MTSHESATYEQFIEYHEPQLLSSGVPERFWLALFEKLRKERLDAGDKFQIIVEEQQRGEHEGKGETLKNYSVIALDDLKKDDPNNIFLVDHMWTFTANQARLALSEVEGLKERLLAAFSIHDDDFAGSEMTGSVYSNCSIKNVEDHFTDNKGMRTSISAGKMEIEGEDNGKPSGSLKESELKESEVGIEGADIDEGVDCTGWAGIDRRSRDERIADRILSELWRYAQTYSIGLRDAIMEITTRQPVWYIPDEFGLRIGHSKTPNTRMVPFFYAFQRITYSLLFLVDDIPNGAQVSRNYVGNRLLESHPDWYDALMIPWKDADFSERDIEPCEKSSEYYMSGRVNDLLPPVMAANQSTDIGDLKKAQGEAVRVCACDRQLIDNLKRVKVIEVSEPFVADIIWKREHFYDYRSLAEINPNGLINQFPFEATLTVKDLVAATIQDAYRRDTDVFRETGSLGSLIDAQTLRWRPDWFMLAYNLDLELPQFVAYFQRRAQLNLDNTWIIKPWNLGRQLDINVTDQLHTVVRLAESGPKIACKYINNPVLFRRPDNGNLVKFDLRYIVFVRQFGGAGGALEALIYNNFWLRFALNDFTLQNLDDPLTHLTVYNYTDKSKIYEMECSSFVTEFARLYPKVHWPDVQKRINGMVKELLEIVCKHPPPCGIPANRQSRAMYGFDVMLMWKDGAQQQNTDSIQPVFIEANFMPDCERACQYYHDFADTAFEALFFGEAPVEKVTAI